MGEARVATTYDPLRVLKLTRFCFFKNCLAVATTYDPLRVLKRISRIAMLIGVPQVATTYDPLRVLKRTIERTVQFAVQ